mmetsp:Transcript_31736/g.78667  ORF Transcript_31736/g.78667 Transcript_31736/m.78667 type:complete len:83 (-) Transcript_31736:246-494(-)
MQHGHATRSTQRADAADRRICNALRTTATYKQAHSVAHTPPQQQLEGGVRACVRHHDSIRRYRPSPGGQPVQIAQSHTNTPL